MNAFFSVLDTKNPNSIVGIGNQLIDGLFASVDRRSANIEKLGKKVGGEAGDAIIRDGVIVEAENDFCRAIIKLSDDEYYVFVNQNSMVNKPLYYKCNTKESAESTYVYDKNYDRQVAATINNLPPQPNAIA